MFSELHAFAPSSLPYEPRSSLSPFAFLFTSLKNAASQRQFSSYRATFEIPQGTWQTVRLPWSEFDGYGPGCESAPFDASSLRRIGVVAIGKEMDFCLGLAGLRFYSVI